KQRIERKFDYDRNKVNIADFIFSENGDTRTSTFVFERQSFNEVLFDDNLMKHQDWDLAIRFSKVHDMTLNKNDTVTIYNDVENRMNHSNNHEASLAFIEKHKADMSEKSLANFYTNLAISTLRYEGKNEQYREYVDLAKKYCPVGEKKIKLKLFLIQLPFINV